MKYKVAYIIKDGDADRKHHRYYDALNERTVLDMFEATKEESLIGEEPKVEAIYKNTAEKGKQYKWEKLDEKGKEQV